jgi:hypothetical protein
MIEIRHRAKLSKGDDMAGVRDMEMEWGMLSFLQLRSEHI